MSTGNRVSLRHRNEPHPPQPIPSLTTFVRSSLARISRVTEDARARAIFETHISIETTVRKSNSLPESRRWRRPHSRFRPPAGTSRTDSRRYQFAVSRLPVPLGSVGVSYWSPSTRLASSCSIFSKRWSNRSGACSRRTGYYRRRPKRGQEAASPSRNRSWYVGQRTPNE